MNKRNILILILMLVNTFTATPQKQPINLSKQAKFSLLTCGPGDELYTTFGHTAIRLQDDSVNIDITFNYGTFDFNTPNFYLKFMNGELDYLLSVQETERFMRIYAWEEREVREAQFILTEAEKQELWYLLYTNMQPENRAYRYDFFFDNCATRVRDLLFKVKKKSLPYESTGIRYRQLIHEKNTSDSWSAQGIDLLLGANTDSIASKSGRAFLPDYLEAIFIENGMVEQPVTLIKQAPAQPQNAVNIPNLVFTLLLITTIAITYKESKQKTLYTWYDATLLIPYILLSLLFMYMWFVSSHLICKWNWNVLWASPLLIMLYIDIFRKKAVKRIMVELVCVDALLVAFIMLSALRIEYFSNIAYLSAAALAVRVNYRLYYTYNNWRSTFSKK